jgi:(p)ppGpp synthase/HD superfamily hydrolase
MTRYDKLRIALRYWLLGRSVCDAGFLVSLQALDFAEELTSGTRKDGVTRAFQHQLEIAHYLRATAHGHPRLAELLACALLHDVAEDYDVGFEEIERRFGASIAHSVMLLTKKHRGKVVAPEMYFGRLAEDNVASLVKGADRIHNLQSMLGVFTVEKQQRYCEEVREHFLPMLKKARRAFLADEALYESIKHVLRSQLELLDAVHAASTTSTP